ncbi:hypothetical protein JCM30760_26100 [Thiomicrorhabdus hydrogeniphila]
MTSLALEINKNIKVKILFKIVVILVLGIFYTNMVLITWNIENSLFHESHKAHLYEILFFITYLIAIHYAIYFWIVSYKKESKTRQKLEISSAVFSNAKEAIIIADANNNIVDVNPEFTKLTGYRRSSVLGQPSKYCLSDSNELTIVEELQKELLEKGFWHGELWINRFDGKNALVELKVTSANSNSKNELFYIFNFIDITVPHNQKIEIEKLVLYDPLTSLPNKQFLKTKLSEAMIEATKGNYFLAVCIIDMDRFNQINELIGSKRADAYLISIANRLVEFVEKGDVVGRTGGDEFLVLLKNLSSYKEIEHKLNQMVKLLRKPINIGLNVIKSSASIGVALYPDENISAETLMRHSDFALYQAKELGRSQYKFFDTEKKKARTHHFESVSRVHKALSSDEFELYYQPKINIQTNEVIGFEALIRWNHPEEGVVLPGDFLPNIDGHGIMIDIDYWVIRQAFNQLSKWCQQGLLFSISVNITNESILEPSFINKIKQIINEYKSVPLDLIQFEVLENSLLKDMTLAKKQLIKVRELGILVALDDFGTGYSSLSYLRNLPTDFIKIDRSFVMGILKNDEDLAIVEGIIQLAKTFKMRVIAEGIENIEILNKLNKMKCDMAQGFFISKPIPSTKIENFLCKYNLTPK